MKFNGVFGQMLGEKSRFRVRGQISDITRLQTLLFIRVKRLTGEKLRTTVTRLDITNKFAVKGDEFKAAAAILILPATKQCIMTILFMSFAATKFKFISK